MAAQIGEHANSWAARAAQPGTRSLVASGARASMDFWRCRRRRRRYCALAPLPLPSERANDRTSELAVVHIMRRRSPSHTIAQPFMRRTNPSSVRSLGKPVRSAARLANLNSAPEWAIRAVTGKTGALNLKGSSRAQTDCERDRERTHVYVSSYIRKRGTHRPLVRTVCMCANFVRFKLTLLSLG